MPEEIVRNKLFFIKWYNLLLSMIRLQLSKMNVVSRFPSSRGALEHSRPSEDEICDSESILAPLLRKAIATSAAAPVFSFVLARYFSLLDFKAGQKDVISHVLSGISTLAVFPTGWGKSLCYMYCTFIQRLISRGRHLTVVVSPLLSVIQDQLQSINAMHCGLRSESLTSCLSTQQQRKALTRLRSGDIDVLYVSPERVVLNCEFRLALREVAPRVALLCIDEAHCVSQWSHDFRPTYMYLRSSLQDLFESDLPPILGLTATASRSLRAELCRILGMQEVICPVEAIAATRVQLSSTFIEVDAFSTSAAHGRLLGELLKVVKCLPTPMLIYSSTQAEADEVASFLRQHLSSNAAVGQKRGRDAALSPVMSYHAGLPSSRRQKIQHQFLRNEILVLAATVAFGMGIDKRDIRSVVHLHATPTIEEYVQQIGRAGRDGAGAVCHLLFCPRDYFRFRQRNTCNVLSFQQLTGIVRRIFALQPLSPSRVNANMSLMYTEQIAAEFGCATETVDTLLFLAATCHPDVLKICGTIPRRVHIYNCASTGNGRKGASISATSDLLGQLEMCDPVGDFVLNHNEIVDILSVATQLSLPVLELQSRLRELTCCGRAKLRFKEPSFLVRFCSSSQMSASDIDLYAKELFHLHRSKIASNNQKLRESFACLAHPSHTLILGVMEDPATAPPWDPPQPSVSRQHAVEIVNSFCTSAHAPTDPFEAARTLCGLSPTSKADDGGVLATKWRSSQYYAKLEEHSFEWVLKACDAAIHK